MANSTEPSIASEVLGHAAYYFSIIQPYLKTSARATSNNNEAAEVAIEDRREMVFDEESDLDDDMDGITMG